MRAPATVKVSSSSDATSLGVGSRPKVPLLNSRAALTAVQDILLQEAASGATILVGAERGLGKTHFLDQVKRFASAQDAVVDYQSGSDLLADRGNWSGPVGIGTRRWGVSIIDDLHAVKASVLRGFVQLCEVSTKRPVLLLASYIDDYSVLSENVSDAISRAIHLGASCLYLAPLDDRDMLLLFESLENSYHLSVDNEVKQDIIEMANGNPGLLKELLRDLRSGVLDKHLVPTSVYVRNARVQAQMSPDLYAILQTAAVIGSRFYFAQLLELIDASATKIALALQLARNLNVIAEDREDSNCFLFVQPAMRKAIYHTMIAVRRRYLHALVADQLRNDDGASASWSEKERELGLHLISAGRSEAALPHLLRAADSAFGDGDRESALRLYKYILLSVGETSEIWRHVHDRIASCYHLMNDSRKAIAHLLALGDFFRRNEDLRGRLSILARLIRIYDNHSEAALAKQTFEEFKSVAALGGCAEHVADGYLLWTWHLWYSGKRTEATANIKELVARCKDSLKSYVPLMLAQGIIFAKDRSPEMTFGLVEEAAHVAAKTNVAMYGYYLHASEMAWELGYLQQAINYNERARLDMSPLSQHNQMRNQMAAIISMKIALDLGRLQSFREHAEWLQQHGVFKVPTAALSTLIGVRIGDPLLVDDWFRGDLLADEVSSGNFQWTSLLIAGFAETMVLRGYTKQLRLSLHRIVRSTAPDPRYWIPLAIAQHGFRGDVAAARERIVRETRGQNAAIAKASLALFEGILASRFGDKHQAKVDGKRAAALFGELGWPLMVAKSLEIAGCLEAAREGYRTCQAWGDVSRLSLRSVKRRSSDLTPREAEVKLLLERGMSNLEIASSLSISGRTAAHHVEAVLGKLGLRSRWQLVQQRNC